MDGAPGMDGTVIGSGRTSRLGRWAALVAAVFGVALAAALGSTVPAMAAETQRLYPPYPDVWGRYLPGARKPYAFIYLLSEPSGKVTVFYDTNSGGMRAMDFFTGEVRESDFHEYSQWDDRSRRDPDYPRALGRLVVGPNDIITWYDSHRLTSECWVNFWVALERGPDSFRAEPTISRMLFSLLETPVEEKVDSDCWAAGGDDCEDRFIVRRRVEQSGGGLILALGDDTFLTNSGKQGVVIRFRTDLTTPFIRNRKLFLVDTAVFHHLIDDCPGTSMQRGIDAVYRYLLNLRAESGK